MDGKMQIDWTNHEAVVRAAVPRVFPWPPSSWNPGWTIAEPNADETGPTDRYLGKAVEESEAWKNARAHRRVVAFERLHRPAFASPAPTVETEGEQPCVPNDVLERWATASTTAPISLMARELLAAKREIETLREQNKSLMGVILDLRMELAFLRAAQPKTEVIEGELSACPFCGSKDVFAERSDFSSCYIVCNNCSTHGPTECQESDEEDTPGEHAAKVAWNRRAAQPVDAGEGFEAWWEPIKQNLYFLTTEEIDRATLSARQGWEARAALASRTPEAGGEGTSCVHCGRRIEQDALGDWFHPEENALTHTARYFDYCGGSINSWLPARPVASPAEAPTGGK